MMTTVQRRAAIAAYVRAVGRNKGFIDVRPVPSAMDGSWRNAQSGKRQLAIFAGMAAPDAALAEPYRATKSASPAAKVRGRREEQEILFRR